MRLLHRKDGDNFSLVEYEPKNIPRYAILSHTWGEDTEEVKVGDIVNGTGMTKAGYRKIRFCGEQAAKDKLDYFWVDTCCIDKSSSAELQEAISSMFQWYQMAARCYVYLPDVSFSGFASNDQSFQKSRWFTRGWTLQELIAPKCVEFFSLEGKRIGDKNSMVQEIHIITGISIQALQGSPLSQFSIDERRSWAKNRHTKRPEDRAYSLLGIFDIHMPLLYGEGRESAFTRLDRKIKKSLPLGTQREPSKHQLGLFSSDFSGEDPASGEHSDDPGLLSDLIEALQRSGGFHDLGVTPRRAGFVSESDVWRAQAKANVNGLSDGNRKNIHGSWLKDQNPEAIIDKILSHARDRVDANERTRLQARNDAEAHNEALTYILEPPGSKSKDKVKASIPTTIDDELPGTSRHAGKSGDEVEPFHIATNTLSNLVLPINSAPHSWQQSTQIEGYFEDQLIRDRIGYASLEAFLQSLLDRRLKARLDSQAVVNDWLDITKFNDQNDIARFYDKQVSSRLEGTCEWIFSHPAYQAWNTEALDIDATRVLWIHAPAGFGKTVLCARLVEFFKDKQSLPIAYFFASPHAQSGGDPHFIIRSWISQIAQLDSTILGLIRRHAEAGQKASEPAIWSLFQSIASESRNVVFVLDGFDEYSRLQDARADFLRNLKKATKQTGSRILITSRDETDIDAELSQKVAQNTEHIILQCKITSKDVRHDISHFSRSVVDKKLPNKDNRLREDLAEQLAEKCDGMFLWIRLQQDQLRGGKNEKRLQTIVKNMPTGLEKTYERNWMIIQGHPPEEKDRALALLRWATFAARPLTVSEITEALLVNVDDNGNITITWDDLPDDIDDEYINGEIIDICGALVEIRTEKTEKPGVAAGNRTIHLIHPSVRDFLLATFQHDTNVAFEHSLLFNQDFPHAIQHEYLAMICLGYINCSDTWQQSTIPLTEARKGNFIDYAAQHWSTHLESARQHSPQLLRQLKDFFHAGNANFDSWSKHFRASEATEFEEGEEEDEEEVDTVTATPLYYAASFNLPAVMENIWAEDPTQLDKVGGYYGTPLQIGCRKGHQEAFRLLLEWGADPNVEGGYLGSSINAAIAGGQNSMVETILRMGVDLTRQDRKGRTPLYIAAKTANTEVVSWLLEAGADYRTLPNPGWSPLLSATISGHLEVVTLLLEKGVDPAVSTHAGWTPLGFAARKGHLEVVAVLLEKGADPAVSTHTGWTPLLSAADSGYLEVVKLLLEKGADPAVTETAGWTPLILAADRGYLEVVKLLLEKGADLSVANNEGWTPLGSASYEGHLEIVKLLIGKGADITVASVNGSTPLIAAVHGGYTDIVKLLIEKGADITVANANGSTPLIAAAYSGYTDIVKLLIEKGADITVASANGSTPLIAAAYSGYTDIVKLLLENGADITGTYGNDQTLLKIALSSHNIGVLKLLLDNGANVTVTDENGWTPLYLAAVWGHLEAAKLLLENGADVTTTGEYLRTPLNSAAENNHLEIVKLLLDNGAYAAANGTDPYYGTITNLLAFKGFTDLLRFSFEDLHADLHLADIQGRTPLGFAARGGHIDTFQYLLKQGLEPTNLDAKGDGILSYASSSGSLEVLAAALHKDLKAPRKSTPWSPLHWACRAGNLEVVELLLKEDIHGDPVVIPGIEGQWSPLAIAISHGNEEMLENLSSSSRSVLSAGTNDVRPFGKKHGVFECDGCMHKIYGPRFHCGTCPDFDYCFMCGPFLKSLHKDHEWDYFEFPE